MYTLKRSFLHSISFLLPVKITSVDDGANDWKRRPLAPSFADENEFVIDFEALVCVFYRFQVLLTSNDLYLLAHTLNVT